MKTYLLFDCYQTLIYKKDLETVVQRFIESNLKIKIPRKFVEYAYDVIYHRYKFHHPRFDTLQSRIDFYKRYNKELFGIIGFEISDELALALNEELKQTKYERFKDTLPTLQDLRGRYPMGLLANWTANLQKVLSDLKLDKYFETIHSSHELKIEKPDPRIFTESLGDKLQKYEKIYYIGDDYELDAIPARKAGLIPILVDREGRYPKTVDCLKINSLEELNKLII